MNWKKLKLKDRIELADKLESKLLRAYKYKGSERDYNFKIRNYFFGKCNTNEFEYDCDKIINAYYLTVKEYKIE